MDVRNCRRCKKLFNYIGGQPICPSCASELEDIFNVVREYLRDNPKATLTEISTDNDVSVQQLKQWVREERLAFTDDSPVAIECEECGAMIKTGRYCKHCKDKMADGMNKIIHKERKPMPKVEKKQDREKERMRFLDK